MTANFEVLDNIFQVAVLMCMIIISFKTALKLQSNMFFTLACAYSCFMMGTLYWMLYIAIMSDIPHTFYVSEISWIASYIFFLSLQILRTNAVRLRFSLPSLIVSLLFVTHTLNFRMMGPSYIISLLFAVVTGILTYVTMFRITHKASGRKTDVFVLLCIILQLAVHLLRIRK